MEDIIKIVKSLEELDLMIKHVSKRIENDTRKHTHTHTHTHTQNGFVKMLLSTLGANLLRNMLAGKVLLKQVKKWLEQVRIFNDASSFN